MVIRCRKSNEIENTMANQKRTNNDLQNTTRKIKDENTTILHTRDDKNNTIDKSYLTHINVSISS
jgi:hypothetical protein